jgi:Ca2+-binding RTX toxin-like protein
MFDRFYQVKNIKGSNLNDRLAGVVGSSIWGLDGNDTIIFRGGNNFYYISITFNKI